MLDKKLLKYQEFGQRFSGKHKLLGILNKMSAVLSRSLLILFATAFSAAADNHDGPPSTMARDAVANHPGVLGFRALICEANSQIDQAYALNRPQVQMTFNGGSVLKSKVERPETQLRRFDNEDIDAVISVTQPIYDWGISERRAEISRNTRRSAEMGFALESERVAADILSSLLLYKEYEQQDALYRDHLDVIEELSDRLETGVQAGVYRLSDLRSLKISILDVQFAYDRLVKRIALQKSDFFQRFNIKIVDALPLLGDYFENRPEVIPVLAGENSREVLRLDFDLESNILEKERLKRERYPLLDGILETTLFDVDGFSNEYEIVGRVQIRLPLYDGGSNKASQDETEWRGRNISSDRQNQIRDHDSQVEVILSEFAQVSANIENNNEKIVETEAQLVEVEAREGQTETDFLAKSALLSELLGLYLTQATLDKELEIERLRGIFFADELGVVLKLDVGDSPC